MFICHTWFSLRYGTLSPEALVREAKARNIDTLVLADINNASGMFAFVRECRKAGIRPVAGMEFRDKEGRSFTGIARNEEGFAELNRFLSEHMVTPELQPFRNPEFSHAVVIYPAGRKDPSTLAENEYIGIRPWEQNKLVASPLLKYRHKLLAVAPVTFKDTEDLFIHRFLRAIDNNTILSKLPSSETAHALEVFRTPEELSECYSSFPFLTGNSTALLKQCEFNPDLKTVKNKATFTAGRAADRQLLEKLAWDGFHYRYPKNNRGARERLQKEIRLIDELGFSSYFLITWDIIRYAQSRGFHHVGRGSGANSIVAYCLKITDVDPLELDLYFERFINPHRKSPPDFDIDFSWDERDEVTDYIFKRYGKDHVGLIATYSTFKDRSTIREVAKVFGLPKDDIDTIIAEPLATDKHHGLAKKILTIGRRLLKFPNQLSIHAGGVLISERPIYYYTPLRMMPKGFPITHFDMYIAEDIGFFKLDILSQRGLGHIKDASDLVLENRGIKIDVHDVNRFKKDPEVKKQLSSANTIGAFYIESPAMRGLLSKLHCSDFKTLVAASSIIRPGVARSGMMREYIYRFHNPDSFNYLHPVFARHLGETFGVMVYQEDVMKIAHHFGGLELGESDMLRRIMSGKRKTGDTFEALRDKYFSNCQAKGYPEGLAEEVWRQIESFSGYSFCKAHSASYAVESYQSLFLKAYYPLEFMVAVINNFGGFYSREFYFHEARRAGARIHPPCVNNSRYLTCIKGDDIYMGFIHLKDLEQKIALKIPKEREENGPFLSLHDFISRTEIKKEQLNILIRIGALRFTGKKKQELLWEKNYFLHSPKKQVMLPALADPVREGDVLPPLEHHELEDAFEQIDLLGFPLISPFSLLKTSFRGEVMACHLGRKNGKMVKMVGYYVISKMVRTVNKKIMSFATWVDAEGNFFDTTHFPQSLEKYPLQGKGCYLILGKVVEEFGFFSLEVAKMAKLDVIPDPRY